MSGKKERDFNTVNKPMVYILRERYAKKIPDLNHDTSSKKKSPKILIANCPANNNYIPRHLSKYDTEKGKKRHPLSRDYRAGVQF